MAKLTYTTPGGINVTRLTSAIPFKKGLGHLLHKLDRYRGIYLSSGYEYPERYSRWDVASVCPPVELVAAGQEIEFRALNARGEALNRMLHRLLEHHPHWETFGFRGTALHGRLKPLPKLFPEEERSKQPSAFSILRAIIGEFGSDQDSRLALVGAFGYDLLFQFDPISFSATTFITWIARRNKSSGFGTTSSWAIFPRLAWPVRARPRRVRPSVPTTKSRATICPKSTWPK